MVNGNEFSVTFVNLHSGDKEAVLLTEGNTVQDLLNAVDYSGNREAIVVTVNNVPASLSTALTAGARVTVTPTNLKAA